MESRHEGGTDSRLPELDESEDSLWRVTAFRLAVELAEYAWDDCVVLSNRPVTRSIATQLLKAAGSIGAHIAEGYSRSSGPDRVRFFEYALGSARESRRWYRVVRHALAHDSVERQIRLLTRVCQLLLATIPTDRQVSNRKPDGRGADARRK